MKMLGEAIGNGLYLSQDRSRVRATPEVETKTITITASSYAEAYQIAFGQPSPYIGRDKAMHEKLILEEAGFTVTIIVPKS